jgi:deoxyribonuclease V
MRIHRLHRWDLTPTEAVALQRELASQIETRTPLTRWKLVAGADISFHRSSDTFYAGVVVLRLPDLQVVERQGAIVKGRFPYVPGLLSFREAPALLEALGKLRSEPDVVMLDGQGTAHPRRIGLACHVGLWLRRPAVGCAKSLLTGRFEALGENAGSVAPLTDKGQVVGMAVRTKRGTKPVYVSPGHLIDLDSAVRVVLSCTRGYRLPEPTRLAHLHVNALRTAAGQEGRLLPPGSGV